MKLSPAQIVLLGHAVANNSFRTSEGNGKASGRVLHRLGLVEQSLVPGSKRTMLFVPTQAGIDFLTSLNSSIPIGGPRETRAGEGGRCFPKYPLGH